MISCLKILHKTLKIPEINIVLCDFCAQQIREDAYLSRDPQRETHSPKPLSDQLVKPAAVPATEGIPLRNVCFFCSSEEMRVREAEGSGGAEIESPW